MGAKRILQHSFCYSLIGSLFCRRELKLTGESGIEKGWEGGGGGGG